MHSENSHCCMLLSEFLVSPSSFLFPLVLLILFTFHNSTVEDDSPSLAVATSGGKILLHSPHIGSSAAGGVDGGDGELPHIRFLNFNKKITALASGPEVECDGLYVFLCAIKSRHSLCVWYTVTCLQLTTHGFPTHRKPSSGQG